MYGKPTTYRCDRAGCPATFGTWLEASSHVQAHAAEEQARWAANAPPQGCDRCKAVGVALVTVLGDRDQSLCPTCHAAYLEEGRRMNAERAQRDAERAASDAKLPRCAYRGCGRPARLAASRGPACDRHYDDLS